MSVRLCQRHWRSAPMMHRASLRQPGYSVLALLLKSGATNWDQKRGLIGPKNTANKLGDFFDVLGLLLYFVGFCGFKLFRNG